MRQKGGEDGTGGRMDAAVPSITWPLFGSGYFCTRAASKGNRARTEMLESNRTESFI